MAGFEYESNREYSFYRKLVEWISSNCFVFLIGTVGELLSSWMSNIIQSWLTKTFVSGKRFDFHYVYHLLNLSIKIWLFRANTISMDHTFETNHFYQKYWDKMYIDMMHILLFLKYLLIIDVQYSSG